MNDLKVLSYNIHKGFSAGTRRYTLERMRDSIRKLQPDLLFLQEVHGEHHGHRRRIPSYPSGSQFEYLAHEIWPHFSYGRNVVYSEGHHGNAVLSKFPILSAENVDVSQNRIERRGILHAMIALPGVAEPIHALSAHLGLLGLHRKRQIEMMIERLQSVVPESGKIIAAGDFNDWREHATGPLESRLALTEAFLALHGKHARTFPSRFPILCLDRIYTRGFRALHAQRLDQHGWAFLSDHLGIWVELQISGQ